jgi:hypothetical protein
VDVLTEIERSNREILTNVWPLVGPRMGGGTLRPVTGALGEELDRETGFDMLWRRDGLTYAMATRCQWISQPYDTFTIRTRTRNGSRHTEFEKRRQAVLAVAMYPQYTLQAYVHPDGPLLTAAICRTEALFDAVELRIKSPSPWKETPNRDGSAFLSVPWSAVNPAHILVVRGADA